MIVGGGVMGASLAYHLGLRQAGRVLLLERGAVCSGETARSGGFIQTHWSSRDEVRLIAYSRTWFQEHAEECAYQQTGYLHVTGAEREPAVRDIHEMLLELGLESQWLSPPEVKKLQPLLRVDDLVGGAYEECSGWANPIETTRWLASQSGVAVCEGVTVLQISHRGGRIQGVETSAGFVACGQVALLAGPWTPQLHPNPARPLPILAKRGQVCYFDRPGGLPRRELAFYDEVTGLYTHTDGETNLVGIDWHFSPVWAPHFCEPQVDADYVQAAQEALAHRFPSLRLSRPVRGVVGLYDFTPDGHPVVDNRLGLDGYLVAAGFSGAGFKSSPAYGLALSEMLLDGESTTLNLDFLRLSRFDTGN